MRNRIKNAGISLLRRGQEFARNHKTFITGASVAGIMASANGAFANALVTINDTTGMPDFHAEVVFSPMITTLVGIVAAAAALWITLAGVGFIKRFMHG